MIEKVKLKTKPALLSKQHRTSFSFNNKMQKVVLLTLLMCTGWVKIQGLNTCSTDDMIHIGQGQLKGTKITTTNGRQITGYLGIPYGKIIQRFAEAVPADPWTETLNATQDAPACLQYPVQFHRPLEIFGQEDCLTLNVYTPMSGQCSEGTLPVLVFFHGGGFVEGQAAMHLYGPQRLLNKDIVLVIMNYRVGAFGFLSTGDEASSGNYRLLDQNLALRWIQNNIAAFGGAPSKVTISGESAGAASVIYHIVSPLSAGLFKTAIHQSGSAICPWAKHPSPLQVAQNIAMEPLVNCTTVNTYEMIECLRKVDAMVIANVTAKIGPTSAPFTSAPVVEKWKGGRFLTEDPLTLLREGRFNKVPVMSAVSEDEATSLFVFIGLIDGSDEYQASEAEVNGFVQTIAGLSDKEQDVTKRDKILKEYFDGADFSNSSDIRLRKFEVGSDAYFKSCNDMTVKLLAKHVRVFFYVFDYASQGTAISNFTGQPDVGHGIMLLYLFNMTVWNPSTYQEDDQIVSDRLVDYWTTFANKCQPTDNVVAWPPTLPSPVKYMNVNVEQTLREDYEQDKAKFWEEIFFSNT